MHRFGHGSWGAVNIGTAFIAMNFIYIQCKLYIYIYIYIYIYSASCNYIYIYIYLIIMELGRFFVRTNLRNRTEESPTTRSPLLSAVRRVF